ncbi:MAG: dUTP diphosphatase, partial [Fenollaria timonensis]
YEVQIRARSGLSIKHGIGLINGIGTIDSDYRGEIKVPLINFSKEDFTIENGMRIAQMVLSKYEKIDFEEVDELSDSERQDGGFGSTGVK